MPMRTTCPSCQTLLEVPTKYVGRLVKCSKCGKQFSVQDDLTSVPTPSPLPPSVPPLPPEVPLPAIATSPRPRHREPQQHLQPSGWGALSFFIGAMTLAFVAAYVMLELVTIKEQRFIDLYRIAFSLAFLWFVCLPFNVAGIISGCIGYTQPDRKQGLTIAGLCMNGISVLVFLYIQVRSIIE